MTHPNWLLIAAVLGLWGPLSTHAAHPAEHLARDLDRAVRSVSWHDIEVSLVCSECDPMSAECR